MADTTQYISQITLPDNETYNLKDSAAARVSHTHGNLTNDGKITSTATIASGDKLVIVDSDSTAGSKITGSSITFGTSTAQWLNNSGKWSTPSAAQVGAATTNHTHTLSLATDTGTSSTTLAHGGKYKLTAGGNSVIFTLPSDNNTTYTISSGANNGQITVTPSFGDAYNVSVTGLGSAAYRGVDSSIGAASTSNNLPTSAAVASFVEGKGYVTSSGVTQITAGSGLAGGTITTTGTISIATGGVSNDMLAGSIANGKLANSAISIAGTSVSLGGSLAADTLRTNLGLSNALHFRGIATVAITDGSTTNPTISGYDFSKKEAGDVIIDKDSAYEFIWSGSKWERLGPDGSYKPLQTAVTDTNASTSATTTFVQAVTQNANGVITVTKAPLDTSGTWTGTANNAINAKYLMNRGANTITITDSTWPIAKTPTGHTNREIVWGQRWTQSGLTYTPSGGSATNNTDTADLRLWLSSSNTSNVLQLNAQIDGMIYALGGFQGNLVGNVFGNVIGSSDSCTGNAATATKFNSARKIELTGAITGSATTDGSNGWTIATTVNHNHDSNYLTAVGYNKSTKKIYYTKNSNNTDIIQFAAGNNISLSEEDNKLTITNSYTLPKAANGTRGGVQIGYTTTGKNYAVQLDSNEKMYVNVPWTDNNTTYSAGTGISLSGTTFSNSGVTGVKGSAESNYRTGQVNITAANVGAVSKNDTLMTTNPFAPTSLRGPYISKIDNALYAADKRWNASAVGNYSGYLGYLFDGSYESTIQIGDNSVTITIDFTNDSTGHFPGYGYGYFYLSFYFVAGPKSVTGRVYCSYEPHGLGWHDLSISPVSDSTDSSIVYVARQSYHNITKAEFTIVGDITNSYNSTQLTQIELKLDRPDSTRTPFLSKYGPETLYYNLTAPNFIGNLTGDVTGNVSGTASNVTGVVAIANGGTGKTTALDGANALISGLPTWTANPTDDTYLIRRDTGGTATFGQVKFSTVWNYIKGKADSTYSASGHTHGNIANNGTITSTGVALANGDQLLFSDSSNSGKIERSSITIGTATNTWLRNDGTWATPPDTNKYHKTGSWSSLTYTATAVNGADALAFTIPTGTTSATVALGNHNHDGAYVAKSAGVTAITWDDTNKKLTRTINGTAADVVTFAAGTNIGITSSSGTVTIANTYSVPLAASGTRGGIKIGYTTTGNNYAVQLSSEKAYVNVPWTDTKVTAVGNHYTPSADSNAELTAAISDTAGTYAKDTMYTVITGIKVQRDAKGHITGITYTAQDIKDTNTTYTFTNKAASLSWGQTTTIATIGGTDITVGLPANPDNDTKVTNTLGTTTKFYITGTTTSTTNTGTQYFDTGVYVSTTAGELVATKFTGALNGTANVANKLGTADKGSTTKPIYLAAGVATECSTYAGGTAVTLNGTSKAASTASFYAPTSAGSSTQALVGGTPTWTNISPSISIGAGTASAAPTVNVSVLGQSGTAQSITTASTAVYGVTKLQDGVSSDSTVLAATAKAAKTASTSATHTLATTTKFFVTGCTSSTTNTAGDDFDTGVYVTTTAGEISALRHSWHDPSNSPVEKAYSYWNPDNQSIDFVFN